MARDFSPSARKKRAKSDTKTLETVAATRDDPGTIIAGGEVVELRFAKGGALSLRAAKLWHSLVDAAGLAVVEDREHEIPLAELNWMHRSKADLIDCIRELQQTVVEVEVEYRGRKRRRSGQLLTDVDRDLDDDGVVNFRFSNAIRTILGRSRHWAALSARAVLAMESRYTLRLYEIVALRVNRRQVEETFDLADLRARLGVPNGKYQRWPDFRRYVLELAIAELNQLAGFTIEWEPVQRRRRVTGVTLRWRHKEGEELAETAQELERPRVGRKARREGHVERLAEQEAAERARLAASLMRAAEQTDIDDQVPY